MDEKIFYSDEKVKITNLRITCDHVTIPLKKLDQVNTNLRVNFLFAGIIAWFCSFVPFSVLYVWRTDAAYKILISLGVVMLLGTTFWVIQACRNYVELFVTVSGKKVRLYKDAINQREYIFKIADELVQAIIEDRQLKDRSDKLEEQAPQLSFSETLKLRMLLKDQDNNRFSADDFSIDSQKGETEKPEGDTPVDPTKESESKEEQVG